MSSHSDSKSLSAEEIFVRIPMLSTSLGNLIQNATCGRDLPNFSNGLLLINQLTSYHRTL